LQKHNDNKAREETTNLRQQIDDNNLLIAGQQNLIQIAEIANFEMPWRKDEDLQRFRRVCDFSLQRH